MVDLWMWNYNGQSEFGYHSEDIVHAYTSTGTKHRWVVDITDLQRAKVISVMSIKDAEKTQADEREAYLNRILSEPREIGLKVLAHTLLDPTRRVYTRDSTSGNWYAWISTAAGDSWHPLGLLEWRYLLAPEAYAK